MRASLEIFPLVPRSKLSQHNVVGFLLCIKWELTVNLATVDEEGLLAFLGVFL